MKTGPVKRTLTKLSLKKKDPFERIVLTDKRRGGLRPVLPSRNKSPNSTQFKSFKLLDFSQTENKPIDNHKNVPRPPPTPQTQRESFLRKNRVFKKHKTERNPFPEFKLSDIQGRQYLCDISFGDISVSWNFIN